LVPTTNAIGSGYLPTLTAKANLLAPSIRKWPAYARLGTLIARDSRTLKGAQRPPRGRGSEPLSRQLMQIEGVENGRLNPTWCEWWMGFPIGWTRVVSKRSAIRSSPRSLKSSGEQS
jgi:hypothetical protein